MTKTSLLSPLDTGERIAELKLLKHGWLDGKGIAPSHEGLEWFSGVFDQQFAGDLPPPYLYPTPDGHLRCEWSVNLFELSLEINLKSHLGNWHCLSLHNDADVTSTLNLKIESDWEWLATELRRLVEAAEY